MSYKSTCVQIAPGSANLRLSPKVIGFTRGYRKQRIASLREAREKRMCRVCEVVDGVDERLTARFARMTLLLCLPDQRRAKRAGIDENRVYQPV